MSETAAPTSGMKQLNLHCRACGERSKHLVTEAEAASVLCQFADREPTLKFFAEDDRGGLVEIILDIADIRKVECFDLTDAEVAQMRGVLAEKQIEATARKSPTARVADNLAEARRLGIIKPNRPKKR